MFRLDNKTAIITGGGSGIGKGIATLFAAQGANVEILDMDVTAAHATAAEIKEAGGKIVTSACDVSLQNEVREIVEEIAARHGAIDILVNNAGIAHIGTAESTMEKDFNRVFDVNVKGVYNLLHCVIPYMKAAGGSIVNLASVAATIGIPDRFAYSMTKGAIVAMTLSVAKDYLSYGIRCNCISPARVHTPFVDGFLSRNYPGREAEMLEKLAKTQPIGRMAQPAEIAHFALYLCSEEASFLTGCDYPIDGGFTRLNN